MATSKSSITKRDTNKDELGQIYKDCDCKQTVDGLIDKYPKIAIEIGEPNGSGVLESAVSLSEALDGCHVPLSLSAWHSHTSTYSVTSLRSSLFLTSSAFFVSSLFFSIFLFENNGVCLAFRLLIPVHQATSLGPLKHVIVT